MLNILLFMSKTQIHTKAVLGQKQFHNESAQGFILSNFNRSQQNSGKSE